MATVISNESLLKHNVDKYNFKVLSTVPKDTEERRTLTKDNHPARRESDVDSSSLSESSKESLIESLMQKTDEMSSNFIKLQMKLESMQEEHKNELQKVKQSSFEEGFEAGKAQALKDKDNSMEKGLEQISSSILTLEEKAKDYEKALDAIKDELVSAALDIAKEVVSVELRENSTKIAFVLSKELIKELQSASKITLRVNPKNHGEISKRVGSLKHVEVISDSAISEGGVIALSDVGNIDAQISKRFDRVKRVALSE
ncbi:MAG: flagellar assembly protein FliH [Epsilonproteobacteria bacterium]|nr:flagellar assembly protein FliH [Campylobacterota bacterium]